MDKKILKAKVFAVVAPCGHPVFHGFFSTRRQAEKIASFWENGHPGQVYPVVELVEKEVHNG